MLKGIHEDAVYYALIVIFLAATLYLLSPALFRISPPTPSNPVITSPVNATLVNLTILTSSQCKALCDTSRIEGVLTDLLVRVNVTGVDVETEAGRRLAEEYNVTLVPAYVFDYSLNKSPAFGSFSKYIRQSGKGFVVNTLEASSGYLFRNQESDNATLDLYVSTLNVPSIVFQNTTFNVLRRFNNTLGFNLHYVLKNDSGVIKGMFFDMEGIEAAIQLCMLRADSQNATKAIACRGRDILSCYNSSPTGVGFCAQFWQVCVGPWFDTVAIERCVKTENQTLLRQEFAETSNKSYVSAVPTAVIGNQYMLIGEQDEFKLLSTICAVYPLLDGCIIRVS